MPKNYLLKLKGWVGGWSFDPIVVDCVLSGNPDKANVLIDSPGGDLNAGLSIRAAMMEHGNVHVHFVGANASAATVAAMGAKHISMDSGACMLIHRCSCFVDNYDYMNEEQLSQLIEQLQNAQENQRVFDSVLLGIYAQRCKKPFDKLKELFQSERWITAEEALEWGLIDEITTYKEDTKPVITDEIIDCCSRQGVPLPPFESARRPLLSRVLDFFSGAERLSPTPKPKNMIKYSNLSSVAGTDVQAEESESVSMQHAHAAAVDAAISERDARISDLEAQIADRDSQIEQLRKEPGAGTGDVVDHTRGNNPAPVNKYKAADAFVKAFS